MPRSATMAAMKTLPQEDDLKGLLGRVALGEAQALAELYRRVEGNVFAFALSRLGDTEAASDLLHEVMLTVWRRASTFRRESRAMSWILGIAHHKIVDSLRRSGRWQSQPPDEEAADEGSPSPFELAARDQRQDAVHAALAKLSDHHRQVVHLAFFEDLSYPEIAQILEIPPGTVKTRMFHAKKALQRHLRGHLEGATP